MQASHHSHTLGTSWSLSTSVAVGTGVDGTVREMHQEKAWHLPLVWLYTGAWPNRDLDLSRVFAQISQRFRVSMRLHQILTLSVNDDDSPSVFACVMSLIWV